MKFLNSSTMYGSKDYKPSLDSDIENMQVAHVNYNNWNEEKRSGDWELAKKFFTFEHKEACEFIFYIGNPQCIPTLRKQGFSKLFRSICRDAKKLGYKYICFYA